MPWSDWQDPFDDAKSMAPRKVVMTSIDSVVYKPAPGDPAGQIQEVRDGVTNPLAPNTGQVVSPFDTTGNATAQQFFNPYDPPDPTKAAASGTLVQRVVWYRFEASDYNRPWLPPGLDGLVEGVDYALRPDRDGSEVDAYVEYEDGQVLVQPGDFTGWANLLTLAVNRASMDNEPDTVPARGRAYVPDEWIPEPTEAQGDYLVQPFTPPYGTGSTLTAIISGALGASSEVRYDLPADKTRWQAIVEPSFDTFGYDSHSYDAELGLTVDSRANLLYPRWRYWVPDTKRLPLRQRQRDDGLGMSTARWRRGSSRQASNRWRGYL